MCIRRYPPKKLVGGVFGRTPPLQLPLPVAVPLRVDAQLLPFVQSGTNGD